MKTVIRQILKRDSKFIKSIFLKSHQKFIAANNRFFGNKHNILLVAFHNGISCGFLYAHVLDSLNSNQPKMFLYSIDVFDHYRRKSIGTSLIARLKQIAKRWNCAEMFVLTNSSNIPAMGFYKANGGKRENPDDVMFVYSFNSKSRRRRGTV